MGGAAGGLTLLTYGIAQAIENGSCGTDEYGNVLGAPCPDGFGPMILLMILGAFAALAGAALASSLVRFILPAIIAVCAGVLLGFLDVNETDTRPGFEVIAVVAAPIAAFCVPFLGRRRSHGHAAPWREATPDSPPPMAATFASAPPKWQPAAPAAPAATKDAEDIAARLRQLDQLKASGLLDDAAYDEQRKRILSEL
ncbi:hypothetical protein C8N24_1925 [Solirubrobacter pauli]|uniref:Uncharacterized protein n=2 Tax=Solirubrobacter pauli TaxID=166793 RepID=A0A660LCJ8_9ACTN|nr:hypothetical protein C8N24_1925 [Solirubrobacter pauli]